MSELTDRAAYLRGLAEGMGLTKEKNENRLLLEMLELVDEMARKLSETDENLEELEAYVEELDSDLGEVEEALFGDEEDECDCCDCDECDDEECDCCNEELSFDCPSCGKTVMLKASDIDYDQSPVCQHCGKPFFTDLPDEDDE